MIDLKESVALGAAWLDSLHPGWHKKIDIFALDMRDMEHCILGQLYGDLGVGMEQKKDASWEFWLNHGIMMAWVPAESDAERDQNYQLMVQQYRALTEQWRGQIEERNK